MEVAVTAVGRLLIYRVKVRAPRARTSCCESRHQQTLHKQEQRLNPCFTNACVPIGQDCNQTQEVASIAHRTAQRHISSNKRVHRNEKSFNGHISVSYSQPISLPQALTAHRVANSHPHWLSTATVSVHGTLIAGSQCQSPFDSSGKQHVDDAASFIGFVHEEVGKTKLSREKDPALPVLYQKLPNLRACGCRIGGISKDSAICGGENRARAVCEFTCGLECVGSATYSMRGA